MSNYDEIKRLLETSRTLLGGEKLNEQYTSIKKTYGIITERENDIDVEEDQQINTMKDIENKIDYETADDNVNGDEDEVKNDKKKGYRISGGILVLHGKDKSDTQLTTDEKIAFQETMDEFVSEVTELADFNKLNVYPNNVEWSGKINERDLDFFFSIGETDGVYINGTMIKLDEDFLELVNKIKTYYEKFKSRWSKIIAAKKKTPEK
jgi:hypothetical protein